MDEETHNNVEKLKAAKISVLERMVEKGWASHSIRNDADALFILTPKGEAFMSELRAMLSDAEDFEIYVFSRLVKNAEGLQGFDV